MTLDSLMDCDPGPLPAMLAFCGATIVSCGVAMGMTEFFHEEKDELNKGERGR